MEDGRWKQGGNSFDFPLSFLSFPKAIRAEGEEGSTFWRRSSRGEGDSKEVSEKGGKELESVSVGKKRNKHKLGSFLARSPQYSARRLNSAGGGGIGKVFRGRSVCSLSTSEPTSFEWHTSSPLLSPPYNPHLGKRRIFGIRGRLRRRPRNIWLSRG